VLSRLASVFAVLETLVVLAACALIALGLGGCDGPSDGPSGGAAWTTTGHSERGAVQFVAGYQNGFEIAQSHRRPMLVFFTAEWCGYCHQMAREAFTDPTVVRLSEQFVCILVDADAEPEVCKYFGVRGYPTVQFISPGGVPLNRVTGMQPADQLAVAMQQALQAVARRNETPPDDTLKR